jgi:predicted RNA-binding protein YlqC (UPF0109 family)
METKLAELIKNIFGDDLKYEISIDGDNVTVNVEQEQMGIVIGKSGRHANAFRELLKVYNKLHGTNFNLEITEK